MIINVDIDHLLKTCVSSEVHDIISMYIYLQLLSENNHVYSNKFKEQLITDSTFEYLVAKGYVKDLDDSVILKEKGLKMFNKKIESIESWIEIYRKLFPATYRGDKRGCTIKMKKFIKLHKYNKQLILDSTELYLSEKKKENYAFLTQAHYFIEKNQSSMLASYCERIISGEQVEDDNEIYKNTKQI